MSIINQTLSHYLNALDTGFGLIGGDVRWLFNILVMINIALSAMFWAFSDDQVFVQLARKIIFIGIFAWIVENWAALTNIVAQSFMLLGVKAGGGTVAQDIIRDPGAIADRGLTTVTPLIQAVRDLSGPTGFFINFPEIVLLCVAILLIILAFFLIAIQVVLAILTFKLGALATFVLVPFSLLNRTAFIAERPLGWVVAAGVRLMLLTIVVGLGESIYGRLQFTAEPITVRTALDVALGAVVLMLLALLSSRLASDLAMGTARLGALDAAFALGATGAAALYGTRATYQGSQAIFKGGRAALGGGLSAARAAASLRQGSSKTAPSTTPVPPAQKPPSQSQVGPA